MALRLPPSCRVSTAPLVAALVVAAGAVGGCGGGSSSGDTTPGDLADRSPQEIVDASVAALATVHSYRIEGELHDDDGLTRLRADVTDARAFRATYTTKGSTVSYIVTRGRSYVRGDRAFWLDGRHDPESERIARTLAGRWVVLPGTQAQTVQRDVDRLMPTEQAHCLSGKLGHLTKVGVRTVRGRRVVVIRDDGRIPGGTPGELSVATHGRALPMRERQTGRTRPGGTFDPRCDDATDTTTRSDATISHYDKIPPIKPPPHPFDPRTLPQPPTGSPGLSV